MELQNEDEEKWIAEYNLLTSKPVIYAANVAEDDLQTTAQTTLMYSLSVSMQKSTTAKCSSSAPRSSRNSELKRMRKKCSSRILVFPVRPVKN